jgi:hypothetical protein
MRDHLVMLVVIGAVVALSVLGSRNSTFRFFYEWPTGATWSNMVASLEWITLAGLVTWYFRDNVGKQLASWIHHHQSGHRGKDREQIAAEIRAHVAQELEGVRQHITDELTVQHDRIVRSINGGSH